jgi:hypothetical protein
MENAGPILVVGGRTTGLAMACELTRHGAPVRIIDKWPGIDPTWRATLLHSRTLEIFHDMGIVGEVLGAGVEVRALNHHAGGRRFLRVEFGEVASPYPRGIALGENVTEAILKRHLGRPGVAVERRTEFVEMEQRADRIRATLRHAVKELRSLGMVRPRKKFRRKASRKRVGLRISRRRNDHRLSVASRSPSSFRCGRTSPPTTGNRQHRMPIGGRTSGVRPASRASDKVLGRVQGPGHRKIQDFLALKPEVWRLKPGPGDFAGTLGRPPLGLTSSRFTDGSRNRC